jgi:hypothetical protein
VETVREAAPLVGDGKESLSTDWLSPNVADVVTAATVWE